jgi:hypothetical protein
VPDAPLRATRFGLVPDGDGWFVLNAAESRWRDFGPLGAGVTQETTGPARRTGGSPARPAAPPARAGCRRVDELAGVDTRGPL